MPDPTHTKIDAMLCDHAEAQNGKLFVNGAGITIYKVAPEPPHNIGLHLAAVVEIPYSATNEPHTVSVTLIDEDGQTVVPWRPDGAPEGKPIEVEGTLNVGRPANLPVGESQNIPLAFGFQGIALSELGRYSFQIELDGNEVRRLSLRVIADPNQT